MNNKPKIRHNYIVKEWLFPYFKLGATLSCLKFEEGLTISLPTPVEDIIIGLSYAGATGFIGQPKIKPDLLFDILATQEVITTNSLTTSLSGSLRKTAINDYFKASRAASLAIERYIERNTEKVKTDIQCLADPEEDLSPTWTKEQLEAWKHAKNIYQEAMSQGVPAGYLEHVYLPSEIQTPLTERLGR